MGEKGAGGDYEKDTKKRDGSKRDNKEKGGRGKIGAYSKNGGKKR